MKNPRFITSLILSAVLLALVLPASAQEKKGLPGNSDFCYFIANETRMANNQIEFDLMLLNLKPDVPFELGTVQAGITVNPAIYNKGTVTASIIHGSSDLKESQAPKSILFKQSLNCIKMASKVPPGIDYGTIISSDPSHPTRVCRIRLTNTTAFAKAKTNLTFCYSSKPYPTKISRYDSDTRMNTLLEITSNDCANRLNIPESEIKSSKTIANSLSAELYPNPNAGNFTLTVTSKEAGTYRLSISDESGKVIHQQNDIEVNGSYTGKISLNEPVAGTYNLVISNDKEKVTRKLVIKK